jgi:hypothetical protein
VKVAPAQVLGGVTPAELGPEGAYTVTLPQQKGAARLSVANRYVAPSDAERDAALEAFVHPKSEPATPLTDDEAHVRDVLRGLVRVLAERPVPDGAAWTVRYD